MALGDRDRERLRAAILAADPFAEVKVWASRVPGRSAEHQLQARIISLNDRDGPRVHVDVEEKPDTYGAGLAPRPTPS